MINDHNIVEAACSSIEDLIGEETVVPTETSLGGEDFSNYLDIVPGALLRLGAYSGGGDLHSASFKVNEASIGLGIKAGIAALLGLTSRV